MRRIKPNCREILTEFDVDFITSVLSPSASQSKFLCHLLTDPQTRDHILDDPDLYDALRESPCQLKVSLSFYFYILVRKSLCEAGLNSRDLADYIATLLSEWAQSAHLRSSITDGGRACYEFTSELWSLMANADERSRYDILVYMGNHYLFMTGIFPEHIRYRSQRSGSPRLKFYEAAGKRGFELAAQHRLALHHQMHDLYHLLAVAFTDIRHALNDLSERRTFISG